MGLEFDICQTKLRNQFFFFSVESLTLTKNCRICLSKNPQVIEERPLHPNKNSLFDTLFGPKVWLAEIPPNINIKKIKRINACNTTRGGHFNDVVFHTMSTFNLYNKKEISGKKKKFFLCFIYVNFWKYKMEDLILLAKVSFR